MIYFFICLLSMFFFIALLQQQSDPKGKEDLWEDVERNLLDNWDKGPVEFGILETFGNVWAATAMSHGPNSLWFVTFV